MPAMNSRKGRGACVFPFPFAPPVYTMRKFRLAIWERVVVIWETKFAAKRVLGAY